MFKMWTRPPLPRSRSQPSPARTRRARAALARSTRTRPGAMATPGARAKDFRAALGGLPDSLLRACPAQARRREQIARAATPPPAVPRMAEVTPPAAILPPARLHAACRAASRGTAITKPPPVASRARSAPVRRVRWAALLDGAIVFGALALVAGVYLALGRHSPIRRPRLLRTSRRPPARPDHDLLAASPTRSAGQSEQVAAPPSPIARPPRRRLPRRRAKFLPVEAGGRACGPVRARAPPCSPRSTPPVRAHAGLDGAEQRKIPPGQVFQVLYRPVVRQREIAWYRIEGVAQGGAWSGWIGGRPRRHLLVRAGRCRPGDLPPAPAAASDARQQGRVTLEPPLPSRVRAAPHTGGDYLGQLQPGRVPHRDQSAGLRRPAALVVAGAYGQSRGWMAEGAGGDYYTGAGRMTPRFFLLPGSPRCAYLLTCLSVN